MNTYHATLTFEMDDEERAQLRIEWVQEHLSEPQQNTHDGHIIELPRVRLKLLPPHEGFPTERETSKWESRLVDAVIAAKYDGEAGGLAVLCSELLGRLRALRVQDP